jgi:hypothetical protein
MSTSPLGEFVKSTMYLVVTVTMDRRKVDVPVVGALAVEMMAVDQVIRLEKESTCLAAPLLFLPQRRKALWPTRVVSPSCRPVSPVPIIWASLASHFRMSSNRYASVPMQAQTVSVPELPAFAGWDVPIPGDGPTPTFARMPEEHPASEFLIEPVIEQLQGLRTDHCSIAAIPASRIKVLCNPIISSV